MTDEVIMCKDCKHWNTNCELYDFDEKHWCKCPVLDIMTKETFYCSEAERKDHD